MYTAADDRDRKTFVSGVAAESVLRVVDRNGHVTVIEQILRGHGGIYARRAVFVDFGSIDSDSRNRAVCRNISVSLYFGCDEQSIGIRRVADRIFGDDFVRPAGRQVRAAIPAVGIRNLNIITINRFGLTSAVVGIRNGYGKPVATKQLG